MSADYVKSNKSTHLPDTRTAEFINAQFGSSVQCVLRTTKSAYQETFLPAAPRKFKPA